MRISGGPGLIHMVLSFYNVLGNYHSVARRGDRQEHSLSFFLCTILFYPLRHHILTYQLKRQGMELNAMERGIKMMEATGRAEKESSVSTQSNRIFLID